ncbi:MAG TPA: AI-2E family transporter [Ramlibacter sp.]|uniref:AI-2E family transporter n=1 Tax=Ramlibacter sp. TaxID=1917967 RepID=UPI002D80FB9E|nr:AI-2E family transporter [Ramlibacter sp.]HET8744168.1 AI-2E family transporter [Ramlibacter sp.]
MKRPLTPTETTPELERLRLRSIVVAAVALIGVLYLHLLSALFAGLAGFVLYRRVRDFTGPAQGSWKTRTLRWIMVSLAVAGLALLFAAGAELLFKSGGLGRLMDLVADTLDQLRATAPGWVVDRLPESADAVQHAVSRWLREHSGQVQRWGGEALKVLVHIILGLAIGLMAATAARNANAAPARRPLIQLAQDRMLQLANAFGDVFSAQLRISLINAALTALYLLVLLPALGFRIPLAPTLVGFTFFGGLIPIVGNLLSNSAITIAALTVSVWIGAASLVFLIVIHKLEYFLNARIVGGRTNVPTSAMLASMLVLESAFGLAGLVAAPIYCAWLTRELRDGEWV